jgi:putative spermidine/putrescine transport system ATP-binding protein
MSMADLRLVGLTKSYGPSAAVDGIDLDVCPGQLVTLLGPSGCGKTTILRMVAGLVNPSAGDILFRGRSMIDVPVHKRGVGVLFQNYALFPHMRVAGNVSFGLEMRSNDRARTRALVGNALEMVQLTKLAERYPHELSGGQQQRVALARALVIEPSFLLLDEPFGALDKKLREDMQLQLKDIQTRLKVTTIMVTHDQEEALTISDRVAVMNAGRIEQFGSPADIYHRPTSRFVAQFIGASNLFEGEVAGRLGSEAVVQTTAGVAVTAASVGGDQHVTLCLRPETIQLSPTDHPEPRQEPDVAAGRIERIIYRGAMAEYHIRLASGRYLLACRPNGELDAGLSIGSAVLARWPTGKARLIPNRPD